MIKAPSQSLERASVRHTAPERKPRADARPNAAEDDEVEDVEDLADSRQARKAVRRLGQQEGDAACGEGEVEPGPGEA